MAQIVHICAPDGTRFERIFGDKDAPEQILKALRHPNSARLMGRSATVNKKDAAFGEVVPHPDHESPWTVDHSDTVICVGVVDDAGEFKETKRLAGPPAPKDEPTDGK